MALMSQASATSPRLDCGWTCPVLIVRAWAPCPARGLGMEQLPPNHCAGSRGKGGGHGAFRTREEAGPSGSRMRGPLGLSGKGLGI